MKITVKCHAEAGDRYPYFELEVRGIARYYDVTSTFEKHESIVKATQNLTGGDVWGGKVTLDRAAIQNKSVSYTVALIIDSIKLDNQKVLAAFPEEKFEATTEGV